MIQNPSKGTMRVRLTVDVTYVLHGEDPDDLLMDLHRQCARVVSNGLLTGGPGVEVDPCQINATVRPEPLSEDEIARFMLQRIEDGNLGGQDMPTRLARYGLMEPDTFIAEMRERMENT